MAGLTDNGFTPKTQEQIEGELSSELIDAYADIGEVINTGPDTRFGQLIDIFSSEMASAWLALQDIYNSYFPATATGVSLDKANSITNTPRILARSSRAQAYLIGDADQNVEQTNLVTVTGTTNDFALSSKTSVGPVDLSDYIIDGSINAITGNNRASSGTVDLSWEAEAVTVNWNDTATQIKAAIETHSKISEVSVLGNFDGLELGVSENFPIFIKINLISTTLTVKTLTIENNLLLDANASGLTIDAAFSSDLPANLLSVDLDAINAPMATLIVPKTVVAGWSSCYNVDAAILGRVEETDAQYRLRRLDELSRIGTATPGGIEEAVVAAIGTDTFNVSLIENDSSTPVLGADGVTMRAAHSFEVFVNAVNDAATNNAIAQAIYDSKAAGIQPVSTDGGGRSGEITDVNNEIRTLPFSSTVDVDIYIIVERTKNSNYPTDGDDQIKSNLINFFNQYDINEDVLHHTLYTPVNRVTGMDEVTILIGKSPFPTLEENIDIAPFEVATTITDNITVKDI